MNLRRRKRALRGRRVRVALAAVLAWAALDARAAEPERDAWREGRPPDGSFRVRVPVEFEAFRQENEKDPEAKVETQGVRATQSAAFDGKILYVASCLVVQGETRSESQRIEETVASWAAQSELASKRTIELSGVRGVEFELADRVKQMRVRILAPARRTCTVLVQWNHYARPSEADIDRFLDSFELTGR